jgi:hypothetical protein
MRERLRGKERREASEEKIAAAAEKIAAAAEKIAGVGSQQLPLFDKETEPPPILKPRWDRDNRQLWLGQEKARRPFQKTAPSQFWILDTFEKVGWSPRIEVPKDNTIGVKDAVENLNRSLETSRLRFGYEHGGQTITWRLTSD